MLLSQYRNWSIMPFRERKATAAMLELAKWVKTGRNLSEPIMRVPILPQSPCVPKALRAKKNASHKLQMFLVGPRLFSYFRQFKMVFERRVEDIYQKNVKQINFAKKMNWHFWKKHTQTWTIENKTREVYTFFLIHVCDFWENELEIDIVTVRKLNYLKMMQN